MRSHRREAGQAELLDNVTPTTASLLQWWFGAGQAQARGGLAFTETQQQAIVNTIAQHETACRQHRVAPPRHRVNLHHELDKVQVMLALLLWQLLNHADADAAGLSDPRFTRHFVAIVPCRSARERLMDALWGQALTGGDGARDFSSADLVRFAEQLIPEARRDEVHAFMCGAALIGRANADEDWIVITEQPLETLNGLARLPHLMVFAHEARSHETVHLNATTAGRRQLRRLVSMHGKPCMEVVFPDPASEAL